MIRLNVLNNIDQYYYANDISGMYNHEMTLRWQKGLFGKRIWWTLEFINILIKIVYYFIHVDYVYTGGMRQRNCKASEKIIYSKVVQSCNCSNITLQQGEPVKHIIVMY